jgi:acetylornithine deacetylase
MVDYPKFLKLLQTLIQTPSFSREETKTANILVYFLDNEGIKVNRVENNIWISNLYFDDSKPTILLNSHHDTVEPNAGYTKDPFSSDIIRDRLYGLGSNDAGGSLIALLATFMHFYNKQDLHYNLIWAASAEEEISGKNGMELLFTHLPVIDFAVIGEPTQMNMAIAEKGLMVLDCISTGVAGHAAREEGVNAIYLAMKDISWFQEFQFSLISEFLGPVKMSVTMIQSGKQHNVVPNTCKFTVDVRTTDTYTNEEVLEIIKNHVDCEIQPRSTRLKPSFINPQHPIVLAGKVLGCEIYGSPTLSDQSLINVPSLKMGPGDSARSHTADEYIKTAEFEQGIDTYIKLLTKVL